MSVVGRRHHDGGGWGERTWNHMGLGLILGLSLVSCLALGNGFISSVP